VPPSWPARWPRSRWSCSRPAAPPPAGAAGDWPLRAWELLAGRPGPFAPLAGAVAARIALGLPVGSSLGQAAGSTAGAVAPLAAALDLCERSGAPTAEVLEGLAAGLRAEAAASTDTRIALAAPKATATVMSVLPVAGLGLGALLGVDSVQVLAGTAAGHACLLIGGGLWVAGWWWIRRLVRAAQRAGDGDP
jgi:tight adherence protein B